MYRHTTPTPLKYILQNDFESASEVPLIDFEFEAEKVWGDYPGGREGAGRYADLFSDDVPVGRLWGTDQTVGLLHVPVQGGVLNKRKNALQHWNAAMKIRQNFHLGIPAATTFDQLLAMYEHDPVVETNDLSGINFPEIDAIFYVDRYDPEDDYIWCEEMK